jgi:hypothetical protein
VRGKLRQPSGEGAQAADRRLDRRLSDMDETQTLAVQALCEPALQAGCG